MLRSPLIHFLLIGGLLFGLRATSSRMPETPAVFLSRAEIEEQIAAYARQMRRPANEREAAAIERRMIDEAIWLEEARSLGLHRVDSVVRRRLVQNMRFLGNDAGRSDEELFERAIELEMDRSDPVVQRRLVDRVQAIVRATARSQPIAEAAIEAHYRETLERWREPALLDLTHVYLSRDRRGSGAFGDAELLLAVLREAGTPPEEATSLGDPFLAGHRLRGASPTRIESRLGPAFESGVREIPVGRWSGPVESAFGVHLVWVHSREESRVPPLDEIRQRVVDDWQEARAREALETHVAGRREVVEVRIVDSTTSGDSTPE
ncbi:MAG: peptidyl-prolyl cis-trans isomerase [Deltaproteobacteria bacterium]|nr:peptidyl-prolyl cis-trans isomerase [Deltaproteobacteria bacterium]